MAEPLWDAEDVIDYIRTHARDGAERMEALRDKALALLPTLAGSERHGDMLDQLAAAVMGHERYLFMLWQTVYAMPSSEELEGFDG